MHAQPFVHALRRDPLDVVMAAIGGAPGPAPTAATWSAARPTTTRARASASAPATTAGRCSTAMPAARPRSWSPRSASG
jgi:hypothetical protein